MKRRHLLIAPAAWSIAMHATAQVADMPDAINKAGRQRMLSQRISKVWIAQALGIQTIQARQIQEKSIALFEAQLGELRAFAAQPDITDTYNKLGQAFGEFKQAVVGTSPGRSAIPQIVALDGKVLALAHQGTVQLETAWAKPAGRLVNIAGRQRMLSQRMAKLYLAATAGQTTGQGELEKAQAEFVAAMQTLHKAPETTSKIQEDLQLADMQWLFFDKALQTLQAGNLSPRMASDVFITSENLLSVMDKVTGMYAALKA